MTIKILTIRPLSAGKFEWKAEELANKLKKQGYAVEIQSHMVSSEGEIKIAAVVIGRKINNEIFGECEIKINNQTLSKTVMAEIEKDYMRKNRL